jgi:hypothetical protein
LQGCPTASRPSRARRSLPPLGQARPLPALRAPLGAPAPAPQLPLSGPVELGATWFHGTKGNPVYDFAVRQGVVCDPQRAAQLGANSFSAGGGAEGGAGGAPPRPPPRPPARPSAQWGVELVRPGAAAPLAGEERAAAVAAMAEYGGFRV